MTGLQEPTFLILTSLAPAPLHGYAIIAEARELSGGTVQLQAGTLYTALDRLTTEGLIEIDGEDVVNGRLRRSYRLTPQGRDVVTAEAERRRAIADRALNRLRKTATAAVAR
jgi:PadR family transcriptional regulator, regulatory protein PadR